MINSSVLTTYCLAHSGNMEKVDFNSKQDFYSDSLFTYTNVTFLRDFQRFSEKSQNYGYNVSASNINSILLLISVGLKWVDWASGMSTD